MCWSAQVSLNTFIVGLFGFTFALANGADIPLMLFMLCFTTMQLAEHFIWKNINVPRWNTVYSWFGIIILFLEVLFAIALMKTSLVKWGLLIGFIVYSLIVWQFFITKPFTKVGSNGHLQWRWLTNYSELIVLLWLFFFLTPLFLSGHSIVGWVAISTILISFIGYYRTGTISSMWCWIANISWLFIIGFVALNICIEDAICRKNTKRIVKN
jgi:hypothetical protein